MLIMLFWLWVGLSVNVSRRLLASRAAASSNVPNVPGVSLGWSQRFVSHECWAGQVFATSHVSAERS